MSHFAKVKNRIIDGKIYGVVSEVISVEPSTINTGVFGDPHQWIQTSYNNNFRNKFAGSGDWFDYSLDMFLSPKPYSSWTLELYEDEEEKPRAQWVAPISMPDDGSQYTWNETDQSWDLVE